MKVKGSKIDNEIMNLFAKYRSKEDIEDLEIALCKIVEDYADRRNKQIETQMIAALCYEVEF